MSELQEKPHAIIVTYPLQGHLNPTVQLAITLASRGFTITFINTHSVHQKTSEARTNAAVADTDNDDIFANARELGLDIRYITVSDGLPVKFDRSLNHDRFMAALLHVFSAHVEVAVEKIMENGPPVSCLIADTYFVWPSMVAKKFGLLYISFWTEAALVFSFYYHLDLLRLNGHFGCIETREDEIEYLPGVRSINPRDLTSYLQDTDITTVCHHIIFNAFQDVKAADFVLCNTIEELEPEVISALQQRLPFFAVGPIFPSRFTNSIVSTSLWSELDCSQWLNTRPHGSVLYVSFGSYAHVSKTDLIEIAYGLLLSNVSFILVLRPDIVSSEDTHPLPDGYEAEMGDRGMIIPWCSQKQVLANPAIGGFLTHCGWNSTLDSIWCEVPLSCFPLYTDQFTNRKLVVCEWKIGINLCTQNRVTRVEVSKTINCLMSKKSGLDFKNKIQGVKQTLENASTAKGSSERNMNQFITDLKVTIPKKMQDNAKKMSEDRPPGGSKARA